MGKIFVYIVVSTFILATIIFAPPADWDPILYSRPYRYRLTVSVEAHGETKTASTVVEVRGHRHLGNMSTPFALSWDVRARCEPSYLRLGEDPADNLFVLVARYATDFVGYTISSVWESKFWTRPFAYAVDGPEIEAARGKAFPLSAEDFPLMIRFRKLGDPLSVEEVVPDDMERSYGPGAKFLSA